MKVKFAIAGALLALGLATPAFADSYDYGPRDGRFDDRGRDARFDDRGRDGRFDDRGRDDFVPGQYRPWQLIGTGEASYRVENDTFRVPGFQRFRQIMVCAYRAPVRLYDLDVRYFNGGTQDMNVRDTLQPNTCTRAIDLRGFRRDIQSVSIDYRTAGFGRAGFEDRYEWGDRRHGGRHGATALVRIYAR